MVNIIDTLKHSIFIYKLNDFVIKLLASLSIFTLTVFFTPNFSIISFPILILSSFTISLLDNLVTSIVGTDTISFGKGIIGFTVATIIIYITQYFIDGYYISVTSTIIAASIYGIICSMIKIKEDY